MVEHGAVALLRAALRRRGRAVIPVSGGSMAPTLVGPGQVEIAAHPFPAAGVGDVVAVHTEGALVVHRVVARDPDRLWTAGDSHWFVDPPVTEASYLGRVVRPDTPPVRRTWARHRRRDTPRTGALRVQPWVFADALRPGYPCACHPARTLPTSGVGRDPARLADLRRELADFDLVIAVQPQAVRPLESLAEVAWPQVAAVALLVGGRIGEGAAGTEDFIPSALTDIQVRPAGFGEALDEASAVADVLTLVGGR